MKVSMEIAQFVKRRQEFQSRMQPESIALLFAAPSSIRNNDIDFVYRQDSDFHYLTGFDEEESALVLLPHRTILFLRPNDPERETWNGRRLGVERASEALQVDEAYSITELYEKLPELFKGRRELYYSFGRNHDRDRRILAAMDSMLRRSRNGESGPSRIFHTGEILHEMRLFKTSEELKQLRHSASVSARTHKYVMQYLKPGMYEYEIEAIFQYEFRKANGREAYPSIVASGENACILHYTENNAKIKDGQLVLIDAGSEVDYMGSDITRSFPAGTGFSPEQAAVYGIVLEAQKQAIEASVPGNNLNHIHEIASHVIVDGLIDLGLLHGQRDEIIEKKEHARFYMHKTSHYLGYDVHDVGSYFLNGQPRTIEPGMVFTVEPGIYIPATDDIPEAFRGTGIRIEDNVVITEGVAEVVTLEAPREIAEILELRRKAHEG